MRFKMTTIAPKGRNEYGSYMSSSNVTRKVSQTINYGDNTTGGGIGGNTGSTEPSQPEVSFYVMLSKTVGTYDGMQVAAQPVSQSFDVIAYTGSSRVEAYICDFGKVSANTEGEITLPKNMGIEGLPTSGMSFSTSGNGTSALTITMTVDSGITASEGTIKFPVNIYKGTDGATHGNDPYSWWSDLDDCETLWLEWQWSLTQRASSSYNLDLTNENASINVDSNGNVLAGAVRPECTATLYYGTSRVENAVYSITFSQAASGISIDTNTGVLTFGSNLNFVGTPLEIKVTATVNGSAMGVKIMTLTKAFPGADGNGISRWLVISNDVIKYNPNTHTVTPWNISAKVMKQTGEDEPIEDTQTIYWGWDTTNPTNTYVNPISVQAGHDYLYFALKNKLGVIYESETIPVIEDGLDGTDGAPGKDGENGKDGAPGKDGTNGTDGVDGTSPYFLSLTNDNASVNCDADGNILANGMAALDSTAVLYHGNTVETEAVYHIDVPSGMTGVGIGMGTGKLTFSSSFTFTGMSAQIEIYATVNNVRMATTYMTITKSLAGRDGRPALSRWLVTTVDAVALTPSTSSITPTTVGVERWKQSGEDEPTETTEGTVKYQWLNKGTLLPSAETTLSNGATVTIPLSAFTYYSKLRFNYYIGSSLWDFEDVELISNGQKGDKGDQGEPGKDGENGRDGTDGKDGAQGRAGAAIRGPVDFYSNLGNRRWCNGQGPTTEDTYWIDVIAKEAEGDWVLTADRTVVSILPYMNEGADEKPVHPDVYITLYHAGKKYGKARYELAANNINSLQIDENTGRLYCDDYVEFDPSTSTAETATVYAYVGDKNYGSITITYVKADIYCPVLTLNNNALIQWGITGNSVNPSSVMATLKSYDIYGGEGSLGTNGNVQYRLWNKNGSTGSWITYNGGNVSFWQQVTGSTWDGVDFRYASGSTTYCQNRVVFLTNPNEDITYWRCVSSYTGTINDTWDSVKSNWESASTFDFVSTNILLADNAKIDFLTGNEIYLRDKSGTITGGMAGGEGYNIWAGSTVPDDAPFRVNFKGEMEATKGKFGMLEIGKNSRDVDAVHGSFENYREQDAYDVTLTPNQLYMVGKYLNGSTFEDSGYVSINPYPNNNELANDPSGWIDIQRFDNYPYTAINTNGGIYTDSTVSAEGGFTMNHYSKGNQPYKFKIVSSMPSSPDENTIYLVI